MDDAPIPIGTTEGEHPINKSKVLFGGGFAYHDPDLEDQHDLVRNINARALPREAEWYVAQVR